MQIRVSFQLKSLRPIWMQTLIACTCDCNLRLHIHLCTFNGWLVGFMVFNATFNNVSVILWRSVLLVEDPEKTTDLPQVTDNFQGVARTREYRHKLFRWGVCVPLKVERYKRGNPLTQTGYTTWNSDYFVPFWQYHYWLTRTLTSLTTHTDLSQMDRRSRYFTYPSKL